MAPRHPELGDMTRRMQGDEDSFSAFDEEAFGHQSITESAFDPFDASTSQFDDSFTDGFGDVSFPEAPTKPSRPTVAKPERRRRRESTKGRLDESNSRRMNGSSTRMDGSSRNRMNGGSSRLNSSRLDGSLSRLDESSSRIDDSSRRRPRTKDRVVKPGAGPSFPRNSRRGSARRSTGGRSTGGRSIGSASTHTTATEFTAPTSPVSERPTRVRRTSRSKEGHLDSSAHSDAPLSPGSNRRSSGLRASGRSPRTRDAVAAASRRDSVSKRESTTASKRDSITSKRDSMANSDARSRIRKEAALKKEREIRKEQEAKMAKLERQKAKLARQKQKTNELLGRKLAKLDKKNGDNDNTAQDPEEVSKSGNSIHSNTREQRRRRRTNLSHNILVRNMNQIVAPTTVEEEQELSDDGETFYDDEMSMSNSLHADASKTRKEAWQRRRERHVQ